MSPTNTPSGALRAALIDVTASLVAALSLLDRAPVTIAPSKKMFEQMKLDYQKSVDHARQALAALERGDGEAERYAELGRACERHGHAEFGPNGEMLFQPPADVIAEQAVEKALAERTPSPASGGASREAVAEKIARIVRKASRDALYNGAGKVINPEAFDEAATAILSLLPAAPPREEIARIIKENVRYRRCPIDRARPTGSTRTLWQGVDDAVDEIRALYPAAPSSTLGTAMFALEKAELFLYGLENMADAPTKVRTGAQFLRQEVKAALDAHHFPAAPSYWEG
jgi:hypothetical protein